jgi:hypothetical protein
MCVWFESSHNGFFVSLLPLPRGYTVRVTMYVTRRDSCVHVQAPLKHGRHSAGACV